MCDLGDGFGLTLAVPGDVCPDSPPAVDTVWLLRNAGSETAFSREANCTEQLEVDCDF